MQQFTGAVPLGYYYNAQGRRKVPRSGAAIYRGRAVAENFFPCVAQKILTYLFFTYEETAIATLKDMH